MTRGHNVVRQMAPQIKMSQTICKSCLLSLKRFASTATAPNPSQANPEPPVPTASPSHPLASISAQPNYKVKAAVLLSRPPIITRDLTPFEKAYFLYQRRLNERLALPFTRYFYYQRGTPGDVDWKRKIKERQTPARDIGVYNAYSEEGWNDELLIGAKESEPEEQIEALVQDAQVEEKEGEDVDGVKRKKVEKIEKPMPRVTEADRIGDRKSLDRALSRTLYLVVKERHQRGRWGFPSSELIGKESLHTAAERILIQSSGPNMNTWVVGNMPIVHQTINYHQKPIIADSESGTRQLLGEKLFFMKARIMAGQANLSDNKFGLEDFKWLSKEEIQKELHPGDWRAVRNVLADR